MMLSRLLFVPVLFLAAFAALVPSSVNAAGDRVALVIGNDDYPAEGGNLPPLRNCVSDARLIRATLESVGFTVTYLENASLSEMDDTLLRWEKNIPKGGTALVYFAGHGIEYEKRNFLMGCNARFQAASRLSQEAMNAETFAIAMLQGGAAHSFLFLDCCREKPSVEWATRSGRTKGGLEDMKIQGDIIIGFAAQPGDLAQDRPVALGPGISADNGPYAQSLAKWLPSGLKHSDVLQKVREEVHTLTEGEQRTWENGSFLKEFYFAEVRKAEVPGSGTGTGSGPGAGMSDASAEKIRQLEAQIARLTMERTKFAEETQQLETTRAMLKVTKSLAEEAIQDLDRGSVGDSRGFALGGGQAVTMKYVPAGLFTMGSPGDEAGRDQTNDNEDETEVELTRHYWMGETEVTQAQWRVLMGTTVAEQREKGNHNDDEITGTGDEHPVYFVSWEDADEFIRRLNARSDLPAGWKWSLPTEAQWERACRAGTTTAFHFGNIGNSVKANFDGEPGMGFNNEGPYVESTTPVKSYDPNAYGLYDMHGNVYEWCADWLADRVSGGIDPAGPGFGTKKARRGGSWKVYGYYCRSAFRSGDGPDQRRGILGFRLALVPVK